MRNKIILLWQHTVLRYALSGIAAAALDVLLLYLLTHYLGVYYIVSAFAAASASFVVRFFLQKFFAFKNRSVQALPRQLLFYTLLYCCTVPLSVGVLYVLVEYLHLWYVAAQVVGILTLASASFFVYRYIIFPVTHAIHDHA